MFVDQGVGTAIAMFMQGTQKERPLTHDLLASILRALGAKIERAIVNELKRTTPDLALLLGIALRSLPIGAALLFAEGSSHGDQIPPKQPLFSGRLFIQG